MKYLKILDLIIKYGFYVLFFATPLIFNPSRVIPSFELFEWNKMMFVYLLTTLIVGAWFAKMILRGRIVIKRSQFDIPLLLFLGSQILATVFSIDRHVSIFGYYSRFHGGLLSTFVYVLLFFAYNSNNEIIKLNRLLLFAIISGIAVSIYGILEKFGIDAHMWVQDVQSRVFSTFGQPNWLAAYLVILLFIAIGLNLKILKTLVFKEIKIQKLFLVLEYFSIILIFYICLLFTKSRSGFLGFWVANSLFWIIYFLKNFKIDKRVYYHLIIINSILLILNFFLRTPFPFYNRIATLDVFSGQQIAEETKPPISSSVIEVGITDSADIRRIVWQGAQEITKHYPLFGTGPETFAFAYYKFRPAAHNLTSEWDFLYNKAHNEFLNIAATSGLIGLSTYLFLILSVLFWSLRQILNPKKNFNLIHLALVSGYLSILVTNFFGFSVVMIGIYFFLIPAFLSSQIDESRFFYLIKKNNAINPYISKFSLLIICLLMGYALVTLSRFWLSDSNYARANLQRQQDNLEDAYRNITAAINLRSDEPVYHDERATIATSLTMLALENNEATLASKLASDAVQESTLALKISPQNINFWKTRTRMLYQFVDIDESFLNDALEAIKVASELAPTDAKIKYNEAVILGRMGKNSEAIDALKNTILLKPDYRDAYIALSIFYEKEGKIVEAKATLQQVLDRVNPNDDEVKKRLENL